MKILQINNFHYVRGGSDRVYFETTRLLQSAGHEVIHFSSVDERNQPSDQSSYFAIGSDYSGNKEGLLTKLRLAGKYLYNTNAVDNLERLIQDEKPDVAHLHIFQSRLSSGILKVLKSSDIPTVMSVHEYKMLCPVYTFIDGNNHICEACQGKYYYHAILKKCNQHSAFKSLLSATESYIRDWYVPYITHIDRFIMVSKFIKEIHEKYERCFADKSSVLYNFINTAIYEPDYYRGVYFLYFGRLSKEKGLLSLVRAFEKTPGINLKIVGDGPHRAELVNMVSQNAIANIEFLGFKGGDELTDIIKNSSFVILPSEWYENNPMTVIEAFTMGKPVIGANIGGIPELVQNNHNGFIFESGNVEQLILRILEADNLSPETYNNLATNARLFAIDNFNENQHLTELLKIYSDTITMKHDCTA